MQLPPGNTLGVEPGHPSWGDTDHWVDKVLLVEALAPAVVSFTFGVPDRGTLSRLRAAGCEIHITVTSAGEALAAQEAGADVLVVQGQEAGGHRGTHDPTAEPEAIDHLGLLEAVTAAGGTLPMVAAGGPGRVQAVILEASVKEEELETQAGLR